MSTIRTARRRFGRTGLTAIALLLGVIATAGQLSSIAHMLLVPHAICREHGAIVHVSRDTVHGTARDDVRQAAYHDADGGGESDDHEHCLCDAVRRAHWVGAGATACTPTACPLTNFAAIRTERAPLSSQAILSLAPKNSPPASRA